MCASDLLSDRDGLCQSPALDVCLSSAARFINNLFDQSHLSHLRASSCDNEKEKKEKEEEEEKSLQQSAGDYMVSVMEIKEEACSGKARKWRVQADQGAAIKR